jgi:hypothetical protein
MKTKLLLFLLLTFNFCAAFPQENESPHYLFPQFQKAKILMAQGSVHEAVMNYNLVTEEMIYNTNGKMLALANYYQVDTIFIGGCKFIPVGKKFYEVVLKSRISFFIQHRKRLSPAGKPAGYGGTSQTSAITSVTSWQSSGKAYELKLSEDFVASENSLYWLLIGNNWLSFISERQLLKLFPDKEQDLKKFIKTNKTDFKKAEEVTALVKYLNEL